MDEQALADINAEIKFVFLKKSAFKRGKAFNLTLEYLRVLLKRFESGCPACGVPFTTASFKRRKKGPRPPAAFTTIDRIDADLGYIMGNCQVLCNRCNQSKKRDTRMYEPLDTRHPAAIGLTLDFTALTADLC